MKVINIATHTDQAKVMCLSEELPTSDHSLLVTGLGHCDPKWLPLVSAKMQQACDNGV